MSFPVWRELKRKSHHDIPLTPWSYNVLSRLKGIETPVPPSWGWGDEAYNVLSRLKGIETWMLITAVLTIDLTYNVLSRLKGIETHELLRFPQLYTTYNVLSRLKGIETLIPVRGKFRFGSYNVLSRLKGIETGDTLLHSLFANQLTMSFPVWREWKRIPLSLIMRVFYKLTMSFPVWRELKHRCGCQTCNNEKSYNVLSRLKGIETEIPLILRYDPQCLQCPFPFEGNWNLASSFITDGAYLNLQCPFPFEGNWNISLKILLILLFRTLQCPFPFEGNWNWIGCKDGVTVAIPYNVLSRLKGIETLVAAVGVVAVVGSLTMSFPVWRELKRRWCLCGWRLCRLQCPFPFEGNWN